jgi:hypothetical protein
VSAKDVHAAVGRYLADRERSEHLRRLAAERQVSFAAVRAVLHVLADHCGRGRWACWLLRQTIADDVEVSVSVVKRVTRLAADVGVIEVTRQGPHANGYRFTLDKDPPSVTGLDGERGVTHDPSLNKRGVKSGPKRGQIRPKEGSPTTHRTKKRTKAPRSVSVSANAHRSDLAFESGERSGAPEPASICDDGNAPTRPQPAQGGPGRCSDDGADPADDGDDAERVPMTDDVRRLKDGLR